MQIINIIVSSNECPIMSIDSFGIAVPELQDEVVAQAESFWFQKCVDLKFGEECLPSEAEDDYRESISDELEDGYTEIGEMTVSYVWSSIDNVQV